MTPTTLLLAAAGAAVLILAVWRMTRRGVSPHLRRLNRYIAVETTPRSSSKSAKASLYQALDKKMDRVPVIKVLFNFIERHLTMANIPIKTSEFLIAVSIVMVVVLTLQILITGGVHYYTPLVLVGGVIFSFAFLKLYIQIRIGQIKKQLKLAISMLANNLKAGNSFVQALRQVSIDIVQPLKGEFETLLSENQLGIPLDVALNNMLKRVPCKELQTLVRGVILQQETGSNLVYILNTIYQTLQDRDELRQKVSVLTVQGKLSGVVCVSIPFLLFSYMYKVQPDYAGVLMTTKTGHYLLYLCGFLILLGSFFIMRIVRFKF